MAKTRRGKRGGEKMRNKTEKESKSASQDPALEQDALWMIDTAPSTTQVTTSNTIEESKKRKRGKRGGEKKKMIKLTTPPETPLPTPVKVKEQREEPGWSKETIKPESVDEEMKNYLVHMEEKLSLMDFETKQEQDIFIQNVFKEISDHQVKVAADPQCSLILEQLLCLSNDSNLREFFASCSQHFSDLMYHQFGSHVCQKLLYYSLPVIENEVVNEYKQPDSLVNLMVGLVDQLMNHLPRMVRNTYSSHVFRTLLFALSGNPKLASEKKQRSKKSMGFQNNQIFQETKLNTSKQFRLPEIFNVKLSEIILFLDGHLDKNQLKKFSSSPITGPVLQMLLTIDPKVFSKFLYDDHGKIDVGFFKILASDRKGSHSLQSLIECIDQSTVSDLINDLKDSLFDMSRDIIGNYVVQTLLSTCTTPDDCQILYSHLKIDNSMIVGFPGVLVQMAGLLKKTGLYQDEFFDTVKNLLQIESKDLIFKSLLCFKKEHSLKGLEINHHGTLILQFLLEFEHKTPAAIVNSALKMPNDELKTCCTHAAASRVFEHLFTSDTVSIELKIKMARVLFGILGDIAGDRYASHLVDKIWQSSTLKIKIEMAQELANSRNQILKSFHGTKVLQNCRIDEFITDRKQWISNQKSIESKTKLFSDIIE